jgi:hypothetical protein
VIKDLSASDIALIELLNTGRTDAPRSVILRLDQLGYVELSAGAWKLSAKGRERATKLAPHEQSLRAQFSMPVEGGCSLKGVAPAGIRGVV